jgi:hypothetical protein
LPTPLLRFAVPTPTTGPTRRPFPNPTRRPHSRERAVKRGADRRATTRVFRVRGVTETIRAPDARSNRDDTAGNDTAPATRSIGRSATAHDAELRGRPTRRRPLETPARTIQCRLKTDEPRLANCKTFRRFELGQLARLLTSRSVEPCESS